MASFEERVRQQYDNVAPAYDKQWKSYVFSSLSFLKEWMRVKGTERILDVACGTGALEELIVKEHPRQRMIGVDLSKNMLDAARKKLAAHPSISFFHASATALPFADGAFDLVVCANSFHYFDEPAASLYGMRRVLSEGGRLIILDWCRDYPTCQLCDLFLKLLDPAYQHCYRQRELDCFLREAGLSRVAGHKFKLNWMWGMMIAEAVKR